MIFNVIQDNAYPPPHLFYQPACKREPLSTRLVIRLSSFEDRYTDA